jgi:hypothetical protein
MKNACSLTLTLLALFSAPLWAKPVQPDFAKMIECRSSFGDYQSFALGDFQDEAYKSARGIKAVKQDNAFLSEYALAQPIRVHGHSTQRVVFTAAGIMAVLDTPDAASVARKLGLEIAVDLPGKLMATKVLWQSKPEGKPPMRAMQTISRDVSTVSSHPGKTLLGCNYRLQFLDE